MGAQSSSLSKPQHDLFDPWSQVSIVEKHEMPDGSEQDTIPAVPAGGVGSKHVSAAKQRLLDLDASKPKQWMHLNQTRAATPTDVRRSKAAINRPASGSPRPQQSLAAQMGELLKEDTERPEPSFEEKMEGKKSVLIDKVKGLLGKTQLVKSEPPRMAVAAPFTLSGSLTSSSKASWVAQLELLRKAARSASDGNNKAGIAVEALSQEAVGDEVEKSLGSTYNAFSDFQGTMNHLIQEGLDEALLREFCMDEESEKHLTTYDKWAMIRTAAEQVLQVYTNRSNVRDIERQHEQWSQPQVLDSSNSSLIASYTSPVEAALNNGHVCFMFVDDGRLLEKTITTPTSPGHAHHGLQGPAVVPLLATDLWQVIKDVAPNKVPSGQRLERLSLLGRHVLSVAVALEQRFGPTPLKMTKIVLAVDCELEHFTVSELQRWSFFGFSPDHVIVLPLPRFHGFAYDMRRSTLCHVKGSPKLMLGTGYAVHMLGAPAEAYTVGKAGAPQVLTKSVLSLLQEMKVSWIHVGLFADVSRLAADALNMDFLAGACYSADRQGADMVMEVVHSSSERDARSCNSVVLSRALSAASPHRLTAQSLSVRSMRTVRSYQLFRSQVSSPDGFYMAAQRYALKVSSLAKLLPDHSNFRADVQLHGLYAYATVDMADVVAMPGALCACVSGARSAKAPVMDDVVMTKAWLTAAAGALEVQDKIDAFRAKAIDLVNMEKLNSSRPKLNTSLPNSPSKVTSPVAPAATAAGRLTQEAVAAAAASPRSQRGLVVALVLGLEHRPLVPAALRMAKMFIRNIVDHLMVVVIHGNSNDPGLIVTDAAAMQMLEDVRDKELDFNNQMSRHALHRGDPGSLIPTLQDMLIMQHAGMVVVPSMKLSSDNHDLGAVSSSLAMSIAKAVTAIPVLVVKTNNYSASGRIRTSGLSGGGGSSASTSAAAAAAVAAKDHITAMVYLDTTAVSTVVESVSARLRAGRDVLILAKPSAYERPGLLCMRSRRMLVQARMAVVGDVQVEERVYAGHALSEIPKAAEAEGADLVVCSVAGELPVSSEVQELLKMCKTSVYIFRGIECHANTSLGGAPAPIEVD